MSSNREIITFDTSGDVFLLLETNDDQAHRDQMPSSGSGGFSFPADEDSADEAPAEEAQADNIAPHICLDNEFSDNKVVDPLATSTREIVMQVSSKHLSLASPFFKHMFESRPRDNEASQDREVEKIPLSQDDFESMQTLLCIVHGLSRRVPRRVERSQLLQTVILIDKYELHEVAEVFTDLWFESLQSAIPRSLHQDLASWIYICWGLRKSEDFSSLTKIAIRETENGLEDPSGHVPYWIIDGIQSSRLDILTKFLLTLSSLLELYVSSGRRCRQHPSCDALELGKLTQGLRKAGLHPIPEPSSLNRSIQELFTTVREMDLSPLCQELTRQFRRGWSFSDDEGSFQTCHLNEELQTSLSRIEDSIHGLDIDERSRKNEIRA